MGSLNHFPLPGRVVLLKLHRLPLQAEAIRCKLLPPQAGGQPTAVAVVFEVKIKLISIVEDISVNRPALFRLADEGLRCRVFEFVIRLIGCRHPYALFVGGLVVSGIVHNVLVAYLAHLWSPDPGVGAKNDPGRQSRQCIREHFPVHQVR